MEDEFLHYLKTDTLRVVVTDWDKTIVEKIREIHPTVTIIGFDDNEKARKAFRKCGVEDFYTYREGYKLADKIIELLD